MNNFMGYTSFADWWSTLVLTGTYKTLNWGFTALATGLTLLTGYIYDDAIAVWTLWGLYFLDFVTGISCAWKAGTIKSYRIPRTLVNCVFISALLAASWWMSRSLWIFIPLPAIIIGVTFSTLLISILENLGSLGTLPPSLLKILKERFGVTQIINRLNSNGQT